MRFRGYSTIHAVSNLGENKKNKKNFRGANHQTYKDIKRYIAKGGGGCLHSSTVLSPSPNSTLGLAHVRVSAR